MWFWFAIAAAVVSALMIVLNKRALRSVSPMVLAWSVSALPLPFLTLVALQQSIPTISSLFIVATLVGAAAQVVAKVLSLVAIKNSDLSHIMPLKPFGTAFVYVLGVVVLAETVNLISAVGLSLVVLGVYALNLQKVLSSSGQALPLSRRSISPLDPFREAFSNRYAVAFVTSVILLGVSATFSKLTLNEVQLQNPIFVMVTKGVIVVSMLTVYLLVFKKGWAQEFRQNIRIIIPVSLLQVTMGLFLLFGFVDGPVVLVTGLKRIEVLFAMFLAWIFFGDKPARRVWLATVVMVVGVVLLRLSP